MDQKKGRSILIIEDDKEYRSVLSEKLKQCGFLILVAENGEVGLELLKSNEVDLILLDLIMPKMDGQTFFYHLKNTLKKDIPVIILSNLVEAPYQQAAKDFVVKANTSLDELVEKIKTNLPYKEEAMKNSN